MTRSQLNQEWSSLGFHLQFDPTKKNTLYYVISDLDKRNGHNLCAKFIGQNVKEAAETLSKYKRNAWRY